MCNLIVEHEWVHWRRCGPRRCCTSKVGKFIYGKLMQSFEVISNFRKSQKGEREGEGEDRGGLERGGRIGY